MTDDDFPAPDKGFVLTHTLIVNDVKASCEWYRKMLEGKIVMETDAAGVPCIIKVANSWIILNIGGGEPTDDKPETTVAVKKDHDILSAFLNIRVADIHDFYKSRKEMGAQFITEPKEHVSEIRCYMVDPDGYLIEVGESKR
ncbi:VOC family protein [Methanolobus sp. ZRKC2]|uniref:VOC family protein n=1 Tax=Methanolobus sp. ZRKC2 TaxID=3125783 RepID=UPI003248FBA6